jgi:hypothetical protein
MSVRMWMRRILGFRGIFRIGFCRFFFRKIRKRYRIGVPYWSAVLECRIGVPYWSAVLECRIGVPYWSAVLECRIGVPHRSNA